MDTPLILKRAPFGLDLTRTDFDVLDNGAVVGQIFFVPAALEGRQWMWTLGYGHHEDRTPTHGYEATREAVMAAFAKSCGLAGRIRLHPMAAFESWRASRSCRPVTSFSNMPRSCGYSNNWSI
jgi:hypothetical protein